MRVVAFNGSARPKGNTYTMLNTVLKELESNGIDTELINLAGKPLSGCIACYKCVERKDGRCAVDNDALNDYLRKMIDADGILLGSPVYFGDLTAQIKGLIERTGMVARANGDLLKRKAGASVVAVRRAGAMHAFHSLNAFFLIGQMIIPGSSYWNISISRDIGDAEKDAEGLGIMKDLGRNMAWLMEKIK